MSTQWDLWEEYFEELEKTVNSFKFNVGEKVEVKGSVLERVGKIISRIKKEDDTIEYSVAFGIHRVEYFYEDDLKRHIGITTQCECGAAKTFGKSCIGVHHAFWCKMRTD